MSSGSQPRSRFHWNTVQDTVLVFRLKPSFLTFLLLIFNSVENLPSLPLTPHSTLLLPLFLRLKPAGGWLCLAPWKKFRVHGLTYKVLCIWLKSSISNLSLLGLNVYVHKTALPPLGLYLYFKCEDEK